MAPILESISVTHASIGAIIIISITSRRVLCRWMIFILAAAHQNSNEVIVRLWKVIYTIYCIISRLEYTPSHKFHEFKLKYGQSLLSKWRHIRYNLSLIIYTPLPPTHYLHTYAQTLHSSYPSIHIFHLIKVHGKVECAYIQNADLLWNHGPHSRWHRLQIFEADKS